jgi:SM-20-related protein
MTEKTIATSDTQKFEILIEGLINNGVGSCDLFFEPDTVKGLRANLLRHFCKGEMRPAGVGKNFDHTKNAAIRGDLIRWLDNASTDPVEMIFLDKVRQFYAYLNATCYTGINDFEFHYALYDVGSFYKRHLDQFRSDKGRLLSFVLYLNEDWSDRDGGSISLYLEEGEMTLFPIEGRVVFFKSDKTEHEVHPSMNRPRLSIAGWLKKV